MGKKSFATILVFFFAFLSKGLPQTVLLQVDRGADSIPSVRGPNLKKFSYGFLYAGLVAGADKPGAKIIYGPSFDFGFGARKKYKLSPVYSLGWELGLNIKDYKLKQNAGKTFPDSILNDAERMQYGSVYASFYNRFNFDPHRGNYMGVFMDIGISGEWDLAITRTIENPLPDGSKIQSNISHLPYVNRFNYRLFARVGISHVSVYATYRPSKLFKPHYNYPDLPALTFGVELGIFRQ